MDFRRWHPSPEPACRIPSHHPGVTYRAKGNKNSPQIRNHSQPATIDWDWMCCARAASSRSTPDQGLRRWSSSTTVRYSTSAPLAMSSGDEYSFGEWLMPSLLGTKIIPIGETLATFCESWPAKLGKSMLASPADFAASRMAACTFASARAELTSSVASQWV